MPTVHLIHGDSLALLTDPLGLRTPEGRLIKADACVTDPPYELGFMGRAWDSTGIAYEKKLWRGLIDALKPGAHLLAFSSSRTSHRMTCAIEDAGWEIRDVLIWLYGQGFPKSLDISLALDNAAKIKLKDREVSDYDDGKIFAPIKHVIIKGAPVTDLAKQWKGWGTALKPAYEIVAMARAPFTQMKVNDKTIIENVKLRGTGAINIEGCRLEARNIKQMSRPKAAGTFADGVDATGTEKFYEGGSVYDAELGRWPANVLFDPEAAGILDAQTSDLGGASRFFYCAKPSRTERDYGCDDLPMKTAGELTSRKEGAAGTQNPRAGAGHGGGRNFHATVKPITLMRWLIRLVTPPGGTVIDPFMGSGTTGIAAILEGFNFIGIEREADHMDICRHRIAKALCDIDETEQAHSLLQDKVSRP